MKWSLCLLMSLISATACVVEDKPVADAGTGGNGGMGGDAGNPCGCPDEEPVCLDDMMTCVECTAEETGACTSTAPVCDPDTNTCVCRDDADCKDPAFAQCNTETRECIPCNDNTQCDGVDGLLNPTNNVCNSDNVCVDCTLETEAESCPPNRTCNPSTSECTGQAAGSLEVCDACVADSECGDSTGASDAFKCVPLNYQGDRFPDDTTGFCLKSIELGGSCSNPYRIVVEETSLSGAEADDYCGINEDLTTCPAVQALLADTPCDPENGDEDCPQPAGLCRELPGVVNRCTYPCESLVECVTPGSTCNQSLPEESRYCGS